MSSENNLLYENIENYINYNNGQTDFFSQLKNIEVCDKNDEYDDCAICLDSLDDDNLIYTLNCKHKFHTKCILESCLISNTNKCPLCRNYMNATIATQDVRKKKIAFLQKYAKNKNNKLNSKVIFLLDLHKKINNEKKQKKLKLKELNQIFLEENKKFKELQKELNTKTSTYNNCSNFITYRYLKFQKRYRFSWKTSRINSFPIELVDEVKNKMKEIENILRNYTRNLHLEIKELKKDARLKKLNLANKKIKKIKNEVYSIDRKISRIEHVLENCKFPNEFYLSN